MSDYLIQKIEATPNISVRMRTEAASGQGSGRLEGLTLRDNRSGAAQTVPAAALFVMIGADPRTEWLRATLECDQRGYVLTGHDLARSGRCPRDGLHSAMVRTAAAASKDIGLPLGRDE